MKKLMLGWVFGVSVSFAAAGAALAIDHQTPAAEQGEGATAPGAPVHPMTMHEGMLAPGLAMPSMNAARGRQLFASKGCVVCHAINGVGGEDASPLDFATMEGPMMNPFHFAARMWAGAEAMITLQREELGGQIEMTGDELSDIVAFVHDEEEQKKFSESDIPPKVRELIAHGHEDREAHEGDAQDGDHAAEPQ